MAHTVVRLKGKVDHASLEPLGLEENAKAPLILHFEEVVYLSSSGLAHLARLSSLRDVRLVGLTERVRDVIGLAGLDRLLAIFKDEESALA
ncbi:MAG: STAS domain-containing protein [Planctomycetota bacterium]